MIVHVPCRLGELFINEKRGGFRQYMLTGLEFFWWKSQPVPEMVLVGKRKSERAGEYTEFFGPEDVLGETNIALEIPNELFLSEYAMEQLGLGAGVVGRLHGVKRKEEEWTYLVSYGGEYGAPLQEVRTDELDRIFSPVLPFGGYGLEREETAG